MKLFAPQPLVATHLLNDFKCGEHSLDDWLKRRAMSNQINGASRTFVVVDEENRVYGFYAIAVSQSAGVRALLVHALHDHARQFYEHYGFQPSPQHPMTLMLSLKSVKT